MAIPGVDKAWIELAGLDPSEVCRNASVTYDEDRGCYALRSFCADFFINPSGRTIEHSGPQGEIVLDRFGYFSILSMLWYLVKARGTLPSGELVSPVNLSGGQLFFRGTHVLPLDAVERKYGDDGGAFIKKAVSLCGERLSYGDVSARLFPLPLVPVILILWLGDEEFPPRADLLLDSSTGEFLPVDIIWSVAMLATMMML